MKQLTALLVMVFLLVHAGTLSADCDDDPAIAYLKVIEAMNWPGMRALLAPDAHYLDPTMIFFDRPAIDLRGPDAIVDFWQGESEGADTRKLEFNFRSCAETAGFHMIHYDVTGTAAGATWNVNRDEITITGAVTSVIRIDDGLVKEHRDYVDYRSAIDDVERQRAQYGPAPRE